MEVVQAQSPAVSRHLDRIDTGPGADLSETTTGLNGISAVVEAGRPALVRGPQHILGLYQETACAGAPIRDPLDQRLRGVISLVCGLEVPPALLSTLADTTAAAIERELLHHTESREPRTPAVLVLDGRTRIISDPAGSLLVDPDLAVLEDVAATAVRLDRLDVQVVRLPGSRQVAHLREVLHGGVVAGVLITCDASGTQRPPGDGAARPAAIPPARLPGLVGSSPEWLAVLRRVAEVDRAPVLVIAGEWGTGRATLARAIAARQGRRAVQFDVADLAPDATESWLRTLSLALDRRDLVIVRDAHTLPGRSAVAIRARLARHPDGRLALTGEAAEQARPWHREFVPDGRAEFVEVPALRDRSADLGDLVRVLSARHLAGGELLRLTLDAEEVLRRWSWPGNVAELDALVARLCVGVGSRRPVIQADLPEEMRRVRRTFTGLEQAERTAIRMALQAHPGNRSRVAQALGIGRTTFYRKLRHYGLDQA